MQKETSTFRECRRENDQITDSEILWAGFFFHLPALSLEMDASIKLLQSKPGNHPNEHVNNAENRWK